MSYPEALQWFEYRRKHGGIGEARTAHLLASLCTMFCNANGGKATLHDFLPGMPAPEPDVIDDAEKMMRLWSTG